MCISKWNRGRFSTPKTVYKSARRMGFYSDDKMINVAVILIKNWISGAHRQMHPAFGQTGIYISSFFHC
jgi:hypothetical protein